jgi:F0F1-type ATP synthase assembly protein I
LETVEFRDQQATHKGFGDALALGVEMVFTPLLFAAAGWWLDGRIGTRPLFAILFGALALVGVSVRVYYEYVARMAKEEEGKPWTRHRSQP